MFRPERIVALDVGASSLKLGCFEPSKTSGIELVQYATRDLDADPANEENRLTDITAALSDMIHELHLPAGPVLLSVPGQSVFSRFVKLPPVGKDKILQIVQYEAQQNVPFPIEEVVWDYQLIGSGAGEIDVMLAAIKAEIIEQLTDAIARTGLHPELVDVAPMAIYNAVRYNYNELPACTLVIDIGARSTDLIFIEESRVFNRSIPVGGNTVTQQIMREFNLAFEDADKLKKAHAFVAFGGAYEAPASETADKVSKTVRTVMTRLHTEINRSINFYRTQQSGSQPGQVLLTGGTSIIAYTDTFLKDKLRVEVDYLNPFLNVAVNASIPADEIGGKAHLMGEVVGLALRRTLTCPIELNLLPEKFIKEETFHRKQPMLIASMVAVVLVIVVWCGYFFKLASINAAKTTKIETQVSSLEAVESRLKERETAIADLQQRVDTLSGLVRHRTLWLELLDDIHGRLPDGMWLVHVGRPREGVMAGPPGVGMPGMLPVPDAGGGEGAAEPRKIEWIEITGYAYTDKVPPASAAAQEDGVIRFRNALRSSQFFAPETDVIAWPMPARDDFVREFTIKAVLKQPVEV